MLVSALSMLHRARGGNVRFAGVYCVDLLYHVNFTSVFRGCNGKTKVSWRVAMNLIISATFFFPLYQTFHFKLCLNLFTFRDIGKSTTNLWSEVQTPWDIYRTLFVLYGVISFCISLRSLIDEDASVTVTILDMNALALKMFFNSLNCHASKLLEKVRKRGKTCNWCPPRKNVWPAPNTGKLVTGTQRGRTLKQRQARGNMKTPPSAGMWQSAPSAGKTCYRRLVRENM